MLYNPTWSNELRSNELGSEMGSEMGSELRIGKSFVDFQS